MNDNYQQLTELLDQRKNENSKNDISTPLFADWFHSCLKIDLQPPGYPPDPIILPHPTSTKTGIVVMCIPSLLQPSQIRSNSSSIHCWTKLSTDSTANPQLEIANAIVRQYGSCVPNIKLMARVNPSINDIKSSFTNQNWNPDSRILFHYSQYGASNITPQSITIHSSNATSYDQYPIENVLTTTEKCSIHVIDCDNAGLLLPTYEEFIKTKNAQQVKTDLFAFFSCGANEKLPRSPELPFDLFTSCITTPARTALLWHSRHYYCFKNGPLKPLPIEFFEDASPQIINEVTITLHRLVEAMAYETFPNDLYLKVFHSDSTIAHFAANFFLACRIFSFFNVTPLSYPSLPDLRKNHLWQSFDLQLDVALVQLNSTPSPSPSPSLSYTSYLQQSLKTLKYLMKAATNDISFPSQLTQLPLALTNTELQDEACEIIALYIDKSVKTLRQVLHFPIGFPLFQKLLHKHTDPYLNFSIAKILCFMPQMREIFNHLSHNLLDDIIFPLISQDEKPLFPLIIATHLVHNNSNVLATLSSNPMVKKIIPLLRKPFSDIKIWALLFLSTFIESIPDYKVALVPILSSLQDDSPEVRLVALYTLCSYAGKNLDSNIIISICKLCTDPNPAVRMQLLSTFTYFEPNENVQEALCILQKDQHPDVQRKSIEMTEFLRISKQASLDGNKSLTGIRTCVFDWYVSAVLNPISGLLTDKTKKISEVQPLSFTLKKQDSYISSSHSTFKKMHLGPSISCDSPITTNFCNTNDNSFLVGFKNGDIGLFSWNELGKPITKRITNDYLSYVKNINNNNYPLIFTTNAKGFFYAFRFNRDEYKFYSCFQLCENDCEFEYNEINRKLFVYSNADCPENKCECHYSNVYRFHGKVMIYDLNKEKRIGNITSQYGKIRKIRCLPKMNDVCIVCSDRYEIFDCRQDSLKSVLTFPKQNGSPFDCDFFSSSGEDLISICNSNCQIAVADIRNQNPIIKSYQVGPTGLETLSFSCHSEAEAGAIGNEKGVFVVDLKNGNEMEYTTVSQMFFASKKMQPVKQLLFNKNKFKLAVFQEPNDIISLIQD